MSNINDNLNLLSFHLRDFIFVRKNVNLMCVHWALDHSTC